MTPQRETFAARLAAGDTQAAAYREAFPKSRAWKESTVHSRASELAADGEVQGRVAELQAKAAAANEVSIERLARELVAMAHCDVGELAAHRLRSPKDIANLPEQVRRAIAGWSWDTKGRLVVKLAPKGQAIELLGRMVGAFKDQLSITGKNGGPIETKQVRDLTDEELAAELARHGLKR